MSFLCALVALNSPAQQYRTRTFARWITAVLGVALVAGACDGGIDVGDVETTIDTTVDTARPMVAAVEPTAAAVEPTLAPVEPTPGQLSVVGE